MTETDYDRLLFDIFRGDCLPPSELCALAQRQREPSEHETAHLRDCEKCRARLEQYRVGSTSSTDRNLATARILEISDWILRERYPLDYGLVRHELARLAHGSESPTPTFASGVAWDSSGQFAFASAIVAVVRFVVAATSRDDLTQQLKADANLSGVLDVISCENLEDLVAIIITRLDALEE
jgi:hypothetical protein